MSGRVSRREFLLASAVLPAVNAAIDPFSKVAAPAVIGHAPFAGFDKSPLPADLDAYLSYRHLATEFVQRRNQRIREWEPLGL